MSATKGNRRSLKLKKKGFEVFNNGIDNGVKRVKIEPDLELVEEDGAVLSIPERNQSTEILTNVVSWGVLEPAVEDEDKDPLASTGSENNDVDNGSNPLPVYIKYEPEYVEESDNIADDKKAKNEGNGEVFVQAANFSDLLDMLDAPANTDNDKSAEKDLPSVPVSSTYETFEDSTKLTLHYEPDGHPRQYQRRENKGNQVISAAEAIIKLNSSTSSLENQQVQTNSETAKEGLISNKNSRGRKRKFHSYVCNLCNVGFPGEHLYLRHMNRDHPGFLPYACRHCGKRFKNAAYVRIHERFHDPSRYNGEPQFTCHLCENRFYIKETWKRHLKVKHNVVLQRVTSTTTKEKKVKAKPAVPTKEYQMTSEGHYICPEESCKAVIKTKWGLKKHMKSEKHNEKLGNATESLQKIVKTEKIPALEELVSKKKSKLMKTKLKKAAAAAAVFTVTSTAHKCPHCPRVFHIPNLLRIHLLSHAKEIKFVDCKCCGERFKTKLDLNSHMSVAHPQEDNFNLKMKLYKCLVCGRHDFLSTKSLRDHRLSVHKHVFYDPLKEKPFGCGVCGKPADTREEAIICAVLRHDPQPLKEALFRLQCPACPPDHMGFQNMAVLKKHWNIKHADQPSLEMPKQKECIEKEKNETESYKPVAVPRHKISEVKEAGFSLLSKYDYPLYVDFDLILDGKFKQVPRNNPTNSTASSPQLKQKFKKRLSLLNKNERKAYIFEYKDKVEERFKCEIEACGKVCGSKETLLFHRLKFHSDPIRSNYAKKMKSLKCRFCGEEGFEHPFRFREHLRTYHRLFPRNHASFMKAFACGICGKPYLYREKALICASLRHNPSSLYEQMFKLKCPECPPERLGFHSLTALKSHSTLEHGDGGQRNRRKQVLVVRPTTIVDALPVVQVTEEEIDKARKIWQTQTRYKDIETKTDLITELPLLNRNDVKKWQKENKLRTDKIFKVKVEKPKKKEPVITVVLEKPVLFPRILHKTSEKSNTPSASHSSKAAKVIPDAVSDPVPEVYLEDDDDDIMIIEPSEDKDIYILP